MNAGRTHKCGAARAVKRGEKLYRRRGNAHQFILLPAALFLLGGCESAQTSAAHKIANALPGVIGPAQHYSVHVDGSAFGLARGHARQIIVTGEQVRVAPDAILDTLSVDARSVSFDPQTQRLNGAKRVIFIGTIGQQNLARYVQAHHTGLPGLTVELRAADAIAELPIETHGLHTEISVSGTVAPDAHAPGCLNFVADAASIGSLHIPAALVNAALDLVNPLFDLSRSHVPLVVTHAGIVNGQVVIQGTAKIHSLSPS